MQRTLMTPRLIYEAVVDYAPFVEAAIDVALAAMLELDETG